MEEYYSLNFLLNGANFPVKGDLVLIELEQKKEFGIIISDKIVVDIDSDFSSKDFKNLKNFKIMYKVLSCNKILIINFSQVKEVINE